MRGRERLGSGLQESYLIRCGIGSLPTIIYLFMNNTACFCPTWCESAV